MRKRTSKKLRLATETLRNLDLAAVRGGWDTFYWPCPAPDPETKGWTNCEHCESDEDG
jgi:hypothetical protein